MQIVKVSDANFNRHVYQPLSLSVHLHPEEEISVLQESPRLSDVEGILNFSRLLAVLLNDKIPPTLVGKALEAVIAPIKLKKDAKTEQEAQLLHHVEELVYKPMYVKEEPSSLSSSLK